jgi:hypothetical protein
LNIAAAFAAAIPRSYEAIGAEREREKGRERYACQLLIIQLQCLPLSGGQSISSAEDGGDPSANIDSVFYGAAVAAVGGVWRI